jgi:hypothetical protein
MMQYPRFLTHSDLQIPKTRATDIEKICAAIARKNGVYFAWYSLESVHPEYVYKALFVDKSGKDWVTFVAVKPA